MVVAVSIFKKPLKVYENIKRHLVRLGTHDKRVTPMISFFTFFLVNTDIETSVNNNTMSFFRTLQNSPATISIFHNSKLPLSGELYHVLDKAYYKLNDDKTKFQVDLMSNKMPTYDQFVLIVNSCLKDQSSKKALKNCYPFMYGKKSGEETNRTTVKPPIRTVDGNSGGVNVFSEGEYGMIYDTFNKLKESKDPEVDASDIFQAPLVVDWDQCLIAGDEDGLSAILKKYSD